MKTEEKVGLVSLLGVSVIGLAFLLRPPVIVKVAQICVLPESLVMGIPTDDSPCTSNPALIWGAPPLQKLAAEFEAAELETPALPDHLRAAILEHGPERLYLFGHGWDWLFTSERCAHFLNSRTGLNMDLVPGRYVHLLSCLTAVEMGYQAIEGGAVAFFGYKDYFWLVGKVAPGAGRFCEAALYGDMEIEIQLHNGTRDLQTIYYAAVQRYNDEIAYWEQNWQNETVNGVSIRESEAQMLIDVLIANRDSLRCYYPGGEYPGGAA